MIRQLPLALASLLVAVLLFLLMQLMIKPSGDLKKVDSENAYLNFVRVKPNDKLAETKDRRLPDEPPPPQEPPKTPNVDVQQDSVQTNTPQLAMNLPSLDIPLSGGDGPFLGSPGAAASSAAMFDADVIPVVQIPPTYPRRAKQAGIEGYVKLAVTIRPDGTVSDARVIEAKPKRLFDQSALQAIRRWKFRPKVVDGQPVAQKAEQTIQFKLEK